MEGDALWYEAAQVVGVTNALNVVADALGPDALAPFDENAATGELATTFAEIREFYARADVPLPFRLVAHDPAYARDVWLATRHAFADNRLSRRLKESLAFAVSTTSRSP